MVGDKRARASAAALVVAIGLGGGTAYASSDVQGLEVLSNRADLISGGDALVAARLAGGANPATLRVDLDGTDVTGAFALRPSGRFEGLVTGLKTGTNTLTVRDAAGAGKRIAITNHPIGGPVFAGPQVTPYACNPNASNPPLGAAVDAQCNAPTRVDYLYRNTANQFVAYDPANPPAAALIQPTTTDRGITVPFIVQRVTGTADRGIYQLAVLVDPSKPIEPWSAEQPWSRKLFYPFGGACGTEHRQLAPSSVLQAQPLGAGFVVATSSLNIYANNCNDVVSAEATMMTKEIVIERYGPLKYTMGNGGSAASMQQHLLAENYPGLLDGLTTSQVFEDHWTQVQGSLDCRVLMHYFWPTSPLSNPGHASAPANPLFPTAATRQPVWGSNPSNPDNLCGQKVLAFGADRTELVPTANVACGLQPAQLWNPATNPTGERCGIADFMRAIFGVTVTPDAPNGKGKLAVDNVGVQYGLRALQSGQITAEQFVDLNRKVGGMDIDGNFVAERTTADPDALRIAYETGRVNSATGAANAPRDRQPHRGPDGRHGLPPGVPFLQLSRAAGPLQRQPRQPGDLAVAHRRRGPRPVRRHAPLAGRRRQARRGQGRVLHGRWRAGRSDLQRHVAVLRQPAPGRRLPVHAGRGQVPAQAAGARRLRDHLHGRAVGDACRRRSRRASATTAGPVSPSNRPRRGG